MTMRQPPIWIGWGLLFVLATGPAIAASPDDAESQAFSLLPGAADPLPDVQLLDAVRAPHRASDEGSDGDGSGPPAVPASAYVAPIAAPLAALAKGLVEIGLGIVSSFFIGIAGGAHTFADAAAVVASDPVQSGLIAFTTLGLVGLLSLGGLAAHRYGGLAAVPLFSRIAKADLLENRVRAAIFELIQADPGINVSQISGQLDIAWGTTTHHLQKLRQERLVGIRVVGHEKCYFPNGGAYTPHEMDVLSATKGETAHRIATYLARAGPTTHGALASALDLSPALVTFHARKLERAGILARRREGRSTIYAPLETNLHPTPRPAAHAA